MSSRRHRMDRQVSIYRSEVNVREVATLLEGKLTNLPPISSRTVRVFLSSTFSDMTHERNALMEHVYSKLKKLCRNSYGLEFQVMDLRWGIRDQSHNDHTIIDACLDEIENCNNLSIGPSFVAFIGDKYGYRPFPPNIKAHEFTVLRNALIEDRRNVSILDQWFKIDENTVPAMYRLVPIDTILVNFDPESNTEEHNRDQETWYSIFGDIQTLLRRAANICFSKNKIDKRIRDKFFVSVTEYEIDRGLFAAHNPSKDCLAIYRNIQGLDANLHHRCAKKFTDLKPGTTELDQDARGLLKFLKHQRIPNSLDRANLQKLDVTWADADTDAETDPTDNKEYLEAFCKLFEDKMTRLIKKSVKNMEVMDSYVVEVVQHLKMCQSRCEMFRGREAVVARLREYLTTDTPTGVREPMVVYGESGSGKTSILAKAASLVHSWMESTTPILVLRFLGTSARSSGIRLALGVICWHITAIYDRNVNDIPTDYLGLVAFFHELLHVATAEKPLVIILDSLDQLSPSHNSHDLAWLPKCLPPHVFMIVSTLKYEYDLLDILRANINPNNLVEILPLGQELSLDLIRDWLHMKSRKLTPPQFHLVEKALSQCSLPLYTRLIFEEVCRWKSFTPPDLTVLENTVKGVVNKLLDRVERYQGKTFVSHVLSYITASKHGLSDMEIDDVLSLDDSVLNDVFIYWLPPVRRIPPLLWPRLHNELRTYIIQRESHGVIVYYWYHRQFKLVARERYLSDLGHRLYIHSMLAHYFMGTWGGGLKKPFKYTEPQKQQYGLSKLEDEADRKVPMQPLHIGCTEDHRGRKRLPYHFRKLAELPYHLIESKRMTDLHKEVLFNYEWLHTKLTAMSIHDLLADFKNTLISVQNLEVQIVANSLRIGGVNINEHPNTIAFELGARLLPYYDQHRSIRSLLQSCDTTALQHSCLLPLFQCFESPRGMLMYILEDHTQVVYDLLFSQATNQLISVSKDGSIGFWDIRSGERVKMIDISELSPGRNTRLFQSGEGRYLICDSDKLGSPVYIYDMKSGDLLHKVGARSNMQKRGFIVGNLLCRQKNLIDVPTGTIICSLEDFIESKEYLTCGITPNQAFILIGQKDRTSMFNLKSRAKLVDFVSETMPCAFYITEDNSKCYTGYAEDCLFKVLCIDPSSQEFGKELLTFNYKTSFPSEKFPEGKMYNDGLDEIAINPHDECQVLLNIKHCILVLLRIKANYRVYIPQRINLKAIKANKETQLSGARFSGDGKFILVTESNRLHVWAVQELKFLATVTLHSVDSFPMAVASKSGLLATASQIHTAVKVWDLQNIHHCSGQQIEVYENPIDHVATNPTNRLVYIKKYHGLQSQAGFKYIDFFGIDVWNMSTGYNAPFLPYGNYGQMEQYEASPDGSCFAMLLKNRTDLRVHVINVKHGKVVAQCPHKDCISFQVSPTWEHLTTMARVSEGINEVKLWSMRSGELILLHNVSSPVFTLDGQHLLYIDHGTTIIKFSLEDQQEVSSMQVKASKLSIVPNNPNQIMVTRWPQGGGHQTDVSIWSFNTRRCLAKLQRVAPKGIMDISRDGRHAIDAYLQVYELTKGHSVSDLNIGGRQEFPLVKLTHDGQYAIWADEKFVKVGRVKDGKTIGYLCTHEKPASLTTLEFGYLIVIGREDGHVITTRLVDGQDHLPHKFKPLSLKERTEALLDGITYPDGLIATFDPVYQMRPKRIANEALPKLSDEIRKELEHRAKIPHAVIKTPSAGNLFENTRTPSAERNRRGSSPMIYLANSRRSPGNSTHSSPIPRRIGRIFPAANSPSTLPRRNAVKATMKHKSPSLTDLFSSSNSKPPKGPGKEAAAASGGKSSPGLFTVTSVIQNTGALALKLTDVKARISSTGHHMIDSVKRRSQHSARRNSSGSTSSSEHNGSLSDTDDGNGKSSTRSRYASISSF